MLAADLAVAAVTFTPSLIEVGSSPTSLSYQLTNNGPESVSNSPVLAEFYLSADTVFGDADDVKLGQRTSSHTIPPGASVNVALPAGSLAALTIPLEQPAGDYHVFVKVVHGSGSTLTDTNSTNNVARTASTFRVSNDSIRADLSASTLLFAPDLIEVGAHPTGVSYRVANNGPVAMNNSPVLAEFFLSADTTFGNADDLKIGQRSSTHTIAPGAAVDVTLSQADRSGLTIPISQPPGDYFVFVSIGHGSGSTLLDANLNNNRARTAGTIRVNNDDFLANLAVSAVSFSPGLIEAGANPTSVSYQVSNTGPAAMNNSPVLAEFFLSIDTTFGDADDRKMGEVTSTHTIAPGASANVNLSPSALSLLTVPVSAAADDYFVFVRISHGAGSALSDPNLDNNQARTAGTVRVSNDSTQSDLSKAGNFRAFGSLGQFVLDSNDNGAWNPEDRATIYGFASDTPIIGDWNGDGRDQIGVFRTFGPLGQFILDSNDNGTWDSQDRVFFYGFAGDKPVVGDWNGDGRDEVGNFRAFGSLGQFILDTNNSGAWESQDRAFIYGFASDKPVVGAWLSPSSLLAAGGESVFAAESPALRTSDLEAIVAEALASWAVAGLDSQAMARLRSVDYVIADLPGATLGLAQHSTVYLDSTAAGHGWFIDSTPALDEEYERVGFRGTLRAADPSATGRMDLLTAVLHELGHSAGLEDFDALSESVMSETLPPGIRHKPGVAELDAVLADYLIER